MDAYQNIINLLDKKGINYKIYNHENIKTVQIAREKTNFDINRCLKTLAFEYEKNYILVCLYALDKLDYSKLCIELNINRSKLKKADSKILQMDCGYEDGGIAPISLTKNTIVVFDKKICKDQIIYCGSGCSDKTLEIKFLDLISLDNIKLNDISK